MLQEMVNALVYLCLFGVLLLMAILAVISLFSNKGCAEVA